jgi:hypothetical protein
MSSGEEWVHHLLLLPGEFIRCYGVFTPLLHNVTKMVCYPTNMDEFYRARRRAKFTAMYGDFNQSLNLTLRLLLPVMHTSLLWDNPPTSSLLFLSWDRFHPAARRSQGR